MPEFNDSEGRSWNVRVTVSTVRAVRDALDVDLMEAVEGKLLDRLSSDPVLLVDVLYVVCRTEADGRGVTDMQFGEAMAGDAIEHATMAFLEAIVDFFPNPRDRQNMRKVMAATFKAMDKARDLIENRLASGELERAADAAVRQIVGKPSSNTQASQE